MSGSRAEASRRSLEVRNGGAGPPRQLQVTSPGRAARDDSADVIVVGGGTAGCIIAARMSEDPSRSVLLFEAGPDPQNQSMPEVVRYFRPRLEPDPDYLWCYDAGLLTGKGKRSRQVRGRILGGSSAVNGGIVLRGHAADFDSWGLEQWTYSAVLPSFKRFETDRDFPGEYHGTSGPIEVTRYPSKTWSPVASSFAEAAAERGFPEKPDLNVPSGPGFGPLPLSLQHSERNSTARAYIDPVRARPNLRIRSVSTIEEIVFSDSRAIGVRFRDGNGIETAHADQVVVSAGVFGSPKLLMLSGIGDASQLQRLGIRVRSDVPGVGKNLRCHPGIYLQYTPKAPKAVPSNTPEFQCGLSYSSALVSGEDMQILPRQISETVGFALSVRLPMSAGSVRLGSADPGSPPLIDYNYLAEEDCIRLVEAIDVLYEMLAYAPLEWAMPGPDGGAPAGLLQQQSRQWVMDHVYAPPHGCGTCKMGPADDPEAVVDEWGRVRGVESLRVFDASVFPQSVRGGPYATTMMVGERGAELLA